jgi:hypothetical protein
VIERFVYWCQHLPLAEAIRSVQWAYPMIEIAHIAGVILIFGSVLITNMRLLGLMLKDIPSPDVASGLAPWTLAGFGVQAVSGPLLFITSAERFSESTPFHVKLVLLTAALLYHFLVHRKAAFREGVGFAKYSAVISMALWIGVILAGLGIELLA